MQVMNIGNLSTIVIMVLEKFIYICENNLMMKFRIIHDFSFAKLLKLMIYLSLGLQLIIISQIYFFKPELFIDPIFLMIRFFRGTLLSFLATAILIYPYLVFIHFMNRKLTWKKYPFRRLYIQFPLAIISGLIITPVILILAGLMFNMEYDKITLLNNAYYLVILSLFLMIILEAFIYLEESSIAKIKADNFEKDLILETTNKAKLEAKAQIEEEKNKAAMHLIEQGKILNLNLEQEIRKREILVKELDESKSQLNSIMSNLSGAVYRCYFDEHYTMKYLSEKIFDISGYHASVFIENAEHAFSVIIHPDDQIFCRQSIQKAILQKTNYEFEYRLIHKNGQIVWVSENGKGIYNDNDELTYLDGIIIDISLRKAAQFAAAESDRNYKDLMNFLPQPIFELDIKGHILFTNNAGKEFFGITLPINNNFKLSALDFFIEEDIPRVIENIQKSNQNIKTNPNEYTVKRPDGTLCPVLIYGSPIVSNNKVIGRRGIIIDISERKRQELKLLKAKEELEQINNTLEQNVANRTKQLTEANTQLLKVQKENLQSQFEILKSQINPHFMFNSLNVLSGLINADVTKAQLFIDEFSQIYRYVLETIEQPVVTLNKEFDFMRSYLFLQQIRYGESLTYSVDILAEHLQLLVPPLSLQVLLENAMKHNIVNEEKPLKIEIYSKGDFLFIKNPIQPKISGTSTGLGIKNLIKRYALICKLEPKFKVENNYYVAKIPLIKVEQDERTNN